MTEGVGSGSLNGAVRGAAGDFLPLLKEGREVVGGGGISAEAGGFDVGDLLGQAVLLAVGHGLGVAGTQAAEVGDGGEGGEDAGDGEGV